MIALLPRRSLEIGLLAEEVTAIEVIGVTIIADLVAFNDPIATQASDEADSVIW